MKAELFKVKNYHPDYIPEIKVQFAIESFLFELREVMRTCNKEFYFSKSPKENVKNMGCYLFGQKDKWKAVISIQPKGNADQNEIIIKINNKIAVSNKIVVDNFVKILDMLKFEGIIDDYEVLNKK